MLIKKITYPDYNGANRTETFYFNLTQAEVIEMEYEIDGGLSAMIDRLLEAIDLPEIIKIFKKLILKSYGVKSPDGKKFVKSPELATAFSQTEAYSVLFMELATDAKAASEFINGILPDPTPEQQTQIKKALEEKGLPDSSTI